MIPEELPRSTIFSAENNCSPPAKKDTFDPSSPLVTLPLKIFKQIFHFFSNLSEGELRKILDARSCARVFKQHMPNNVKFLQLYQPQKLQFYFDKLSSHLNHNPFSIDSSHNLLSADRLEENYTHALKLAIQKEDPIQIRLCIEKLGDIYLIKGTQQTLLQAAGLYNYALHNASLDEQASIKEMLSKVRILLIKACRGEAVDIPTTKKQFENNRRELKKFREEIEEKIQAFGSDPSPEEVRELYSEIAQWIKTFFKHLVDQAQEVLGPSPCEYAMIGFGSLAREEMTPYSDLEFGILIQEDTLGNRDYFRRLTNLLHLEVINLGETILPALNIPCLKGIDFFDSVTPRGFAFDGEGAEGKGCKTPFGNRQTFELIQTPEKMAQYISKNEEDHWWHVKERHLPMELLTFTHLLGNIELTKAYNEKIQEMLNIPYQGSLDLRQYLAKQHLVQEDMKNFDPDIDNLRKQGMLFQVKNDFYRFPHLALDRLALLKKIEASDTFTRIDKLNKIGIIMEAAKDKLRDWMSIALFMRLKTYFYYQAQREMMNPLIGLFDFNDSNSLKKQFALDHKISEKVKKIYCIFIPFYQAIRNFIADHENNIRLLDLEDNSPKTQGDINLRLFQFEEAKKCYRVARKADPQNASIFNALGLINQKQGNLPKAAKYFAQAIEIVIKHYGENYPNLSSYYNNRGILYQHQGNLDKAAEYVNKSLEIGRKFFGENPNMIATRYGNLGLIYQEQGNLALATEYTKKALELDIKLFGKNHPEVAMDHNNLGMIYKDWGKLLLSAKHLDQALNINIRYYSIYHPIVAENYNYLGLLHLEGCKLTKAKKYFSLALEIAKKCYTKNHLSISTYCNSLGMFYYKQKSFEQAAKYFEKAHAINLALFGNNHPTVAKSYNALGLYYQEQGNFGKAAHYVSQALKIDRELFGECNPATARGHNNLGMIYCDQGKFEEAFKHVNRALLIESKLFGYNHPTLAIRYYNLGRIHYHQEKLKDAHKHVNQALRINRGLYGENHAQIANNYHLLGQIYKAQRNLKQAAKYTGKALRIALKLFGGNHPDVAQNYNDLGWVYYEQGNLRQAVEYIKKAITINLKLFSKHHPDIAIAYRSLGQIYIKQGNLENATEYIKKALEINIRCYGIKHPNVALYYDELGSIYQKQGNLEEAAIFINQALKINIKLLGEDNLTVLLLYRKLAQIYQAQGNSKKAAEYVKKARVIKIKL
ncbi:hypothetical protein NEOC65_000409 [Neochlamydia sp. AcF65]|uniref:tetratricopeptide repeat protein n=1 Tax=Neochlamydia sp. AcF65 TaxID=2795735 RepID=UPI001BC90166|nr:tetratricopeptide repeat protein [Neochlamydia sp. AcF65]MBS4165352.1 hypothetical protein [Neochlamydia sp. AcF65]